MLVIILVNVAPPSPVAPRRMVAVNSNVVKANPNTGSGKFFQPIDSDLIGLVTS